MDKIKFIRVYHRYNETIWEIIYKSGRLKMIFGDGFNLPTTAMKFLKDAESHVHNDWLHGEETIYERKVV